MADSDIIGLKRHPSAFFDILTFLLTLFIITAGLVSIYSATYNSGMSNIFDKQIIFAAIGLVVMFGFTFIPEKLLFNFSWIIYALSLLLLAAVLVFGVTVYGTKGWFSYGGISFQPAEFGKLATLIMLARLLSQRGSDIRSIRDLFIVLVVVGLPILLILMQPDIGSASVIVAILLGVLFWTGFDLFVLLMVISIPVIFVISQLGTIFLVSGTIVFTVIAVLFRRRISVTLIAILTIFLIGYLSSDIMNKVLPQNSKNRIETFLYPDKDPLGKGYNVIQSKLAVGSGGFTGKGFLQGTQTQLRYIPKQWTDFIYCVPTEEFGFFGGSLVILFIMGLIYRTASVAYEVEDKFFSIICFGIGVIFLYHTLVNIGMVMGLMPVMGIPLPFMSYGGSSLIINSAMVGLVLNAYRHHRKKR